MNHEVLTVGAEVVGPRRYLAEPIGLGMRVYWQADITVVRRGRAPVAAIFLVVLAGPIYGWEGAISGSRATRDAPLQPRTPTLKTCGHVDLSRRPGRCGRRLLSAQCTPVRRSLTGA